MSLRVFMGPLFENSSTRSVELAWIIIEQGKIVANKSGNIFFTPSFVPTSTTRLFQNKNALIDIDITPARSKFCIEIRLKHITYAQKEEIPFSCDNLYTYLCTEISKWKYNVVDVPEWYQTPSRRIDRWLCYGREIEQNCLHLEINRDSSLRQLNRILSSPWNVQ